jgi:hypothetical protein
VKKEQLLLMIGTWTSRADDGVVVRKRLRANEELTERGVRGVRASLTQHRLNITHDIELSFSVT